MQLTGTIFQGTYRLERMIGEGGMGTVYAATHERLARRFAVKVLHQEAAKNQELLARFKREAQITSTLGSDHIVDVVDFNITPAGVAYLVMELLEGEDLEARLQREGGLPLATAGVIFQQVAQALQAAHSKGVVHRDLKPSNIYLCQREAGEIFVKVLDFGISKILGGKGTVVTGRNLLVGTPIYMAPEQVADHGLAVDHRIDIYALGAILYEMLAGRPPLVGSSIPAVLYKIVHEQPQPLGIYRPDLPEALQQLLVRALSKDPQARFPSIKAFWRELTPILGRQSAELRPVIAHAALKAAGAEELGATQPMSLTGGASTSDGGRRTGGLTEVNSTANLPRNRRGLRLALLLSPLVVAGLAAGVWLSLQQGSRQVPSPLPRLPSAVRVRGPAAASQPAVASQPGTTAARAPRPADAAVAPAPGQRQLWLRSRPRGAQVRLNGRLVGQTPLEGQPVPAARLSLQLTAAGYRTRRFTIPPGAEPLRPQTVQLQPLPAILQVVALHHGKPVTASLTLDGKSVGSLPAILKDLAPGPHQLQAARQGLVPVSQRLLLKPGETRRLVLTFAP